MHIIPRAYLRGFSPTPFRKNPLVYAYLKDGSENRISITNACVRYKFYNPPTEVFMSLNIERQIATFLHKIQADFRHIGPPVKKQVKFDQKVIALFVENLIERTPAFRARLENDLANPNSMINFLVKHPQFKEMYGGDAKEIQYRML